jgi:hypothetical protein
VDWRQRFACRAKVRYSCPAKAFGEVIRLGTLDHTQIGLGVYQCEFCGGMHVGHRRAVRLMKRQGRDLGKNIIAKMIHRRVLIEAPTGEKERF